MFEFLGGLPATWKNLLVVAAIFGGGATSGAAAAGFLGLPRSNAERIASLEAVVASNNDQLEEVREGLRQSTCLSYVYLQTIRQPSVDANNMADRCFFGQDEISRLFAR